MPVLCESGQIPHIFTAYFVSLRSANFKKIAAFKPARLSCKSVEGMQQPQMVKNHRAVMWCITWPVAVVHWSILFMSLHYRLHRWSSEWPITNIDILYPGTRHRSTFYISCVVTRLLLRSLTRVHTFYVSAALVRDLCIPPPLSAKAVYRDYLLIFALGTLMYLFNPKN